MKLTFILICSFCFLVSCATQEEPIDKRKGDNPTIYMPDAVIVYPDQHFYLIPKVEGRKVIITAQQKNRPDKMPYIEVEYQKMNGDTLLMISNPFDLPLKFHADLVDIQNRHRQTTSCPVTPLGSNFEHWPGLIFKISLTDFYLVQGKAEGCVY